MINYIIKQFNNSHSAYNGQFYAKAVMINTVTLNDIAEEIERNCSMKKSDVKAVLSELVEVMNRALINSNTVKIDGFGTFKVSLKSSLAPTIDKFSVAHNIHGFRVNFLPEYTIDSKGNRSSALLKGAKVKAYQNFDENSL